jgi:hypothetical protein
MSGKKPSNPKQKPKTSYMFPWLHRDVSKAAFTAEVSLRWINIKERKVSNNQYSTNVIGRFACNNDECPTCGWSSKIVSILIRGYPGNGYNVVIFN